MGDAELTAGRDHAWFEAREREVPALAVASRSATSCRSTSRRARPSTCGPSSRSPSRSSRPGRSATRSTTTTPASAPATAARARPAFPTPRDGVRGPDPAAAQLRRSRVAGGEPRQPAVADDLRQRPGRAPRESYDTFFAKGRMPTWNLMGNGNWATDPGYAPKVLDRLLRDGELRRQAQLTVELQHGRRRMASTARSEELGEAAVVDRAEHEVAVDALDHVRGHAPTTRSAAGAADPAHHLGVAALVDAVLGPRAGIVLRARDLDERHVARRAGRARRGWCACARRSSRRCSRAGATTSSERLVVVGGRCRSSRSVVRTPGGGRTRAPDRRSPAASSSSQPSCSRGSAPPTRPGTAVSSTASVTPSSSTAYGAPSTRQRRVAHRVVVAAHVVHARRRARRNVARNASYSSAVPGVGEVALDHHDVGIEREHLVDDRAVHHLGVRRLARRARAAPGRSRRWRDRRCCPHSVSPKCTSLAVAMVASSRPRRLRERAHLRRQPAVVGLAPSTASVVLGVGLEAGDPRDVVRPGRS